jgi:hypothetical protein
LCTPVDNQYVLLQPDYGLAKSARGADGKLDFIKFFVDEASNALIGFKTLLIDFKSDESIVSF